MVKVRLKGINENLRHWLNSKSQEEQITDTPQLKFRWGDVVDLLKQLQAALCFTGHTETSNVVIAQGKKPPSSWPRMKLNHMASKLPWTCRLHGCK